MKNTITKELQLTQTDITFCYGRKSYEKYMSKNNYPDGYINMSAVTSIVTNNNTGKFVIVMGCLKQENIYELKGLIVHEISHAVTEWMDYYGFKCDEVRSYTMQFLYQHFMEFLDEVLVRDDII